MVRPPGRRVLAWAALLLLWGIWLLGTGAWYFQQEQEDDWNETVNMAFFMKLQLGRTKCKKFQDDLDNCRFQESPEPSNIVTCTFNVSTLPWTTEFQLLNKNCSEGPH
ncbi:Cystatin-9-like protein [Heterocephalus glaber]|uniref:Cystatin-9-like protein n=1 Tax=Heterocephalus glaber TaxID=10181 RepID=G5CBD6_HETGA|nr:Cystatin-9-like protein [Heterocephalus glaber]